MSLRRGPWHLRFQIIVDREASSLASSYLTSNGVNNVVTIVPGNDERNEPNLNQIVRLDILISVYIIESPHYSGMLFL